MKRKIMITLAAVAVFAMAGCGQTAEGTEGTMTGQAVSASSNDIPGTSANDIAEVSEGAEEETAETTTAETETVSDGHENVTVTDNGDGTYTITEEVETFTTAYESAPSVTETETETTTVAVTKAETAEATEEAVRETTTPAVIRPVSITASVSQKTRYAGDTLSATDFTVTVGFSDGSTKVNPAGWYAGPMTLSREGANKVLVVYKDSTGQVQTDVNVQAQAKPTAVSVSAAVTEKKRYVGDGIGASEFTVAVTYSDGSVVYNPAGWTYSPTALGSTSNAVTVSYGNIKTTVTIPAQEKKTYSPMAVPEKTSSPVSSTIMVDGVACTVKNSGSAYIGDAVSASDFRLLKPVDGQSGLCYSFNPVSCPSVIGETNTVTWEIGGEQYSWTFNGCTKNSLGVMTYAFDRSESVKMFNLVNSYRIQNGVQPLEWSEELYNLACYRLIQIQQSGVFSHAGKLTTGENLCGGSGSAESDFTAYNASEVHMNTMKRSDYVYCATAYYCGMNIQVFETESGMVTLKTTFANIDSVYGPYIQ